MEGRNKIPTVIIPNNGLGSVGSEESAGDPATHCSDANHSDTHFAHTDYCISCLQCGLFGTSYCGWDTQG